MQLFPSLDTTFHLTPNIADKSPETLLKKEQKSKSINNSETYHGRRRIIRWGEIPSLVLILNVLD